MSGTTTAGAALAKSASPQVKRLLDRAATPALEGIDLSTLAVNDETMKTARQALAKINDPAEWDEVFRNQYRFILADPALVNAAERAVENAKALLETDAPALVKAQRDARVTFYGQWWERHSAN